MQDFANLTAKIGKIRHPDPWIRLDMPILTYF
jgi:hypothetical protein